MYCRGLDVQRTATVLLYLSDVEEGGETVFFKPVADKDVWDEANCTGNANLVVKPRKGAALLFHNLLPDGTVDEASLHGSCPVRKGVKWSATKWIREKHFLMPEEEEQQAAQPVTPADAKQRAVLLEMRRDLLQEQINLLTHQLEALAPAMQQAA